MWWRNHGSVKELFNKYTWQIIIIVIITTIMMMIWERAPALFFWPSSSSDNLPQQSFEFQNKEFLKNLTNPLLIISSLQYFHFQTIVLGLKSLNLQTIKICKLKNSKGQVKCVYTKTTANISEFHSKRQKGTALGGRVVPKAQAQGPNCWIMQRLSPQIQIIHKHKYRYTDIQIPKPKACWMIQRLSPQRQPTQHFDGLKR